EYGSDDWHSEPDRVGVRGDPVRPPGYSDPYLLTVTIHPHPPSALPRLGVRLQQGTGFRFGDCDYSTKLSAYVCSLMGVGFY
ncbi:MAG TPA: hypothetical protein VFU03_01455, partial [Gemmatimonadales bacterium]|nr:hypothetical protein [Gemmatimonadales bacterium]